LICVLSCVVLSSSPAAAQQRTPTPSGKRLWHTYPLHPKPRNHVAPAATAPPPARAGAPAHQSSGGPAGVRLLIAALAPGVLVLVWLRRRRTWAMGNQRGQEVP
jgi:hypothetical protein